MQSVGELKPAPTVLQVPSLQANAAHAGLDLRKTFLERPGMRSYCAQALPGLHEESVVKKKGRDSNRAFPSKTL